ncbi:EF-hand domain-containing protein [Jannaschia sp. S6380]|uniref:EF-hand domain-containing protein n=1 Tax=Jannaschia sp. S6380 TaxID=2926408 RepID=UPI001FF5F26E|nr:EF-hand domain-containing protein [Jannaschia sp. S6380]MCK0167428.1 EF-hand domain-containing protein [Jannaschia sp. S6380]
MNRITATGLAICAGLFLGPLAAEARGPGPDRPAFGDVDADADGRIMPAELAAFGAERRADRMDRADTNGDGVLTRAELRAASEARTARRVDGLIQRLDKDADGVLSKDELQAGPERRDTGARRARQFSRADSDGDGAIDAAEWDAAVARHSRGRR